ncbi:MAG TPA: hypothetical protein PKZ39_04960, partial [Clostridia bacterium]|nr:hypothetical protein [Clostridia bacterium]
DEQFRDLFDRLNKIKINNKSKNYIVNKLLIPDFWVKPETVVELAADPGWADLWLAIRHSSRRR